MDQHLILGPQIELFIKILNDIEYKNYMKTYNPTLDIAMASQTKTTWV